MAYPKIPAAPLSTARNEKPLIEVNVRMRGASEIVGDSLDIRIYDDLTTEFDDCPISLPEGTKFPAKAEEVCVRKQTNFGEGEMRVIKELFASKEFRELKDKYNKIYSSCDAVPVVTLVVENKNIEIILCDSVTTPYRTTDFPQVLSILFRHFDEIKQGKYSDPPIAE